MLFTARRRQLLIIKNKSSIRAEYCFEMTTPLYERNQNFKSFKMIHNMKLCPILSKQIFDISFYLALFLFYGAFAPYFTGLIS